MAWTLESQYIDIARKIIHNGTVRETRNAVTHSLPFQTMEFSLESGFFPLFTTRQMFYKGVLGEYAAMIRGPRHVKDFERWGCNYWNQWANEDGSIAVDYGNAWRDFNGVDQMAHVIDSLLNNPADRRMVISGWRPDKLDDLNLPCCHHNYQFYSDGSTLDLLWVQRSGDWMVGVPSDVVLSATMLLCFSSVASLKPGTVKFIVGDAHVYADHINDAHKQIKRLPWAPPKYDLKKQSDVYSFEPSDLTISSYKYEDSIKYSVKE